MSVQSAAWYYRLPLIVAIAVCEGTCAAADTEERSASTKSTTLQHFRATRFVVAGEMNLVFDLQWGNFDADPENEVLVVASDGFRLLTVAGRIKLFTPFQPASVWSARAIRLPNQAGFGFVASLPDQRRIAMYGWDGRVTWSLPSDQYTALTVTDLDADGTQEVLAAGRGLKLYAADGKLIRTFSEDFCVTARVMPDDTGAVVACVLWKVGRRADTVTIFSPDGNIIRTWKPPFEFYKFGAVADWGGSWRLMFLNGDSIFLYDTQGREVQTLDAPGARQLSIPLGQILRLRSQEDVLFVVATGKGGIHKHSVFMYTVAGDLEDTSQGEQDCFAVLAVDSGLPGDTLPFVLVGARGEVWKYAERRDP